MAYYEKKYCSWGDDLDGKTLVEAKEYIDELITKHNKNSKLVLEYDWESVSFYIEVEREPTFAELEAENIKRLKKEKADRAKFDKLKAEYGW